MAEKTNLEKDHFVDFEEAYWRFEDMKRHYLSHNSMSSQDPIFFKYCEEIDEFLKKFEMSLTCEKCAHDNDDYFCDCEKRNIALGKYIRLKCGSLIREA